MQLALKFRNMLPEIVRQELDSLVAMISGFFSVEHNPDGTHGAITCSGFTVNGVVPGAWVSVPYDATMFTSNVGANWTVDAADVSTFKYTLVGKTMTLAFTLLGTSLGAGATTDLYITIPGNYLAAAGQVRNQAQVVDVTSQAASCYTRPGTGTVAIQKSGGAAFTASSVNNIHVFGEITFEIQ